MTDRVDETAQTYRDNFQKYVERTGHEISGDRKVWQDLFLSHLPPNGTILEVGAAFGRDAQYFKSKGYHVVCADIAPEAIEYLKNVGFKAILYDFRSEPERELFGTFDGVFASAVLLHAPSEIFDTALRNISLFVKEGGVIAFSLKTGIGEEITNEKMDAPRYFKYWQLQELEEALSHHPFEISSLVVAREGKWLHAIVKKI